MARRKHEDELLTALEKAVLQILNNPDAKPQERLSAIAHGTRLISARHSIQGSTEPDFFGDDTGSSRR